MDHDRIDADRLQQHDVLRKPLAQLGREHRMAAVLDQERPAAKALYIRKRRDQTARPLDQFLHGVTSADSGAMLPESARSKDVTREVFVLNNRIEPLMDVRRVDRNRLSGKLGRIEG